MPSRSVAEPKMESVGRITGMVDCQWERGGQAPQIRIRNPKSQSLVALGDKYALASGLMEITYDTGAKVILQGPVTYEVESPQRRIPVGRQADGEAGEERRRGRPKTKNSQHSSSSFLIPRSIFVVRTPTATVTDLGHGVRRRGEQEGDTMSHVFRG